jgi:hypothetical protein
MEDWWNFSHFSIEDVMAQTNYLTQSHPFVAAHPPVPTTLAFQALPFEQESALGQQMQFGPGVAQPFVENNSAPATPATGPLCRDGAFIGQHSQHSVPPTIPVTNSVASSFPPSSGVPYAITGKSRSLGDEASAATLDSGNAGQHSEVISESCNGSIRSLDKDDLLKRLNEIFSQVRGKPREEELPPRYPLNNPRSSKQHYKVPKARKGRRPTKSTGKTPESQEAARRLPAVERLLRETLHAMRQDLSGARPYAGICSLTSFLAGIRGQQLSETWDCPRGDKTDVCMGNKAAHSTEGALDVARQNRARARSRYRTNLKKGFLELLSIIEMWIMQTRLPDIDAQRRRDLSEICVKMAITCRIILVRFEETLPWAMSGITQAPEGFKE